METIVVSAIAVEWSTAPTSSVLTCSMGLSSDLNLHLCDLEMKAGWQAAVCVAESQKRVIQSMSWNLCGVRVSGCCIKHAGSCAECFGTLKTFQRKCRWDVEFRPYNFFEAVARGGVYIPLDLPAALPQGVRVPHNLPEVLMEGY